MKRLPGGAARVEGLPDAERNRLRLIETGHQDGELDGRGLEVRGDSHAPDCTGRLQERARNREVLECRSL